MEPITNTQNEYSGQMKNPYFNTLDFQNYGKTMLELISKLYSNIDSVPVQPSVKPGFLRTVFPSQPPDEGQSLDQIMQETEEKIFPGIKQWQHPGFFGYYPSGSCHPGVLADLFASTFHSPGFQWNASPSHTELENIVVDWLVQLFQLPEKFLLKNEGGGVIANSATDSFFNSIHAAKVRKLKELNISGEDPRILKFVGYYTENSFISIRKSLMIKDINYTRIIPVEFDQEICNFSLEKGAFSKLVEEDISKGLIPFWVGATYGSTPTCAYDDLSEIVQICKKHRIWLNLDAAYAGSAWVCPEYRENRLFLEDIDSLIINGSKFLMAGNVGTLFYVANKVEYQNCFACDEYAILKNEYTNANDIIDYNNWGISFGRRWNSLKFFYIIKTFGKKGLQEHIRKKAHLAAIFKELVKNSNKFEIFCESDVSLVVFRLKQFQENQDINLINQEYYKQIQTDTTKGLITPSQMKNFYFLRFVVCNHNTDESHVREFFQFLELKAEKFCNK